jgi:hypothetical protein
MRAGIFVICAAVLAASPSIAQEKRTTSDQDVLTAGTSPAPENGAIILQFGQQSLIYFKKPFKTIRLGDPLSVGAVPQSDHIVSFTGLAPGNSTVTLESADGKETSTWGIVTVVRAPHEVKIYVPSPKEKGGDVVTRSGVTIVTNNNLGTQAKEADEAEYKSLLCNEVGCVPVPKPSK